MGANVEVSYEVAWKVFRILNDRYFCNTLIVDEFDIDEMDTELGFCIEESGKYVIGLTVEFECPQQFISTVFHEMVHLYQYQKLAQEPNHGPTFLVWEPIARTTGLDFGVTG